MKIKAILCFLFIVISFTGCTKAKEDGEADKPFLQFYNWKLDFLVSCVNGDHTKTNICYCEERKKCIELFSAAQCGKPDFIGNNNPQNCATFSQIAQMGLLQNAVNEVSEALESDWKKYQLDTRESEGASKRSVSFRTGIIGEKVVNWECAYNGIPWDPLKDCQGSIFPIHCRKGDASYELRLQKCPAEKIYQNDKIKFSGKVASFSGGSFVNMTFEPAFLVTNEAILADSPHLPVVVYKCLSKDGTTYLSAESIKSNQCTNFAADSAFDRDKAEWISITSNVAKDEFSDIEYRAIFFDTLFDEAARSGIDPSWALAVVGVASGYSKYKVGPNGSKGYMQVNKEWLEKIGSKEHNLFDLRVNLRYGCTVLRHYIDSSNGDLYKALNSYGEHEASIKDFADKTLSYKNNKLPQSVAD